MTVFVALAAVGCSSGPPPSTAQQQCEQQAENDPQVKTLADRALGSNQLMVDLRADIKYAYKQALLACLRKQGVGPKGGVEPMRP